jgi:hypothetical protein
MDGAIADGEGPPFPLVCTTEKDVIGNLTRSLKSYMRSGGHRRNVVVATSQRLTPIRIRNLSKRAKELGFVLVQTHTQEAIADLLYRSPEWCRELLGLTGQPPTLSILPITNRPAVTESLLGREKDIDWLRASTGDVLVVGQPGSGKTFLLQAFAKQSDGLFVLSDNRGEIASGLHSQQPKVLIVDDAHVRVGLIASLRQLRTELGADFRIMANCWLGQKDEIIQALQIPSSSVWKLDLLTRDQIVAVINAAGIIGPNDLIHELVSQAEGKPGLAATLCYMCLRGGVHDVVLGDTLSCDIKTTFEPLLGREATVILASFSIGGAQGMSMGVVASHHNLSLLMVHEIVTGLAAGGVLREIRDDRLAVGPPPLRHALVRDIFFKGAARLPIDGLLRQTPSVAETALTLIGARARGAAVADELLISLMEKANSDRAWDQFCWLGPSESTWMLERHPDKLLAVAQAVLHLTPDKALPMLLTQAINDNRPLHSTPEHPLRQIQDWIESGEPGTGQAIARRETLLDSALAWFAQTGNALIALKAIAFALSPAFRDTALRPGSGTTITIRSGFLTRHELARIQDLWARVKEFVNNTAIEDWTPIIEAVERWAYPGRISTRYTDEILDTTRDFASQMLLDVVVLNNDSPGVLWRAKAIARDLGEELSISIDAEFEVLFPAEESQYRQTSEQEQADAARVLARNWSAQEPTNVAKRLVCHELEAKKAHVDWPRWSPVVCEEIAHIVPAAAVWASALISAGAARDLIQPFLQRAVELNEPAYPDLVRTCLQTPELHFAAVSVALSSESVSEELAESAMSVLDWRFNTWVRISCMKLQIPERRAVASTPGSLHSICSSRW